MTTASRISLEINVLAHREFILGSQFQGEKDSGPLQKLEQESLAEEE